VQKLIGAESFQGTVPPIMDRDVAHLADAFFPRMDAHYRTEICRRLWNFLLPYKDWISLQRFTDALSTGSFLPGF
jgi:hypothetical protein